MRCSYFGERILGVPVGGGGFALYGDGRIDSTVTGVFVGGAAIRTRSTTCCGVAEGAMPKRLASCVVKVPGVTLRLPSACDAKSNPGPGGGVGPGTYTRIVNHKAPSPPHAFAQ